MIRDTDRTASYTARRRRLAEQAGAGLILIDSSGLAPDPSLYDRNLTYLTGLTDRDAYLLLAPQGITQSNVPALGVEIPVLAKATIRSNLREKS